MGANRDATIALVTTTSMTNLLNVTAGSTDEGIVDDLINEASKTILNMTGRTTILSTSLTEYYDGDNSQLLLTRSYPITTVASLYVDADREYGTSTLIASGNYMIDNTIGAIKLDGEYLTQGYQSIKVTYTAGWSTAPYDLQRACKIIVTHWYNQTKDNRIGITSRSDAGQSTTYERNIPQAALSIIKRYKDLAHIL